MDDVIMDDVIMEDGIMDEVIFDDQGPRLDSRVSRTWT